MTSEGRHQRTRSQRAVAAGSAAARAGLSVALILMAPTAQGSPAFAALAPFSHPAGGTTDARVVVQTPPASVASVQAAREKTRTRVTKAPESVLVGQDIDITAQLTHKVGGHYRPYAKKKLDLVLLDDSGGHYDLLIASKKTSRKGRVTFALTTYPELAGETFEFVARYQGSALRRTSESDVVSIRVTA